MLPDGGEAQASTNSGLGEWQRVAVRHLRLSLSEHLATMPLLHNDQNKKNENENTNPNPNPVASAASPSKLHNRTEQNRRSFGKRTETLVPMCVYVCVILLAPRTTWCRSTLQKLPTKLLVLPDLTVILTHEDYDERRGMNALRPFFDGQRTTPRTR